MGSQTASLLRKPAGTRPPPEIAPSSKRLRPDTLAPLVPTSVPMASRGLSAASLTGIPVFASEEGAASSALRLPMQFKLAIGAANDPLESEADAMAAGVMSMGATHSAAPVLRRKCSCGGEKCDKCKEEEGKVQRKATAPVTPVEAPPIVHETLRSSGQPLDASTRAFFEPRFGGDLSGVRVHTDGTAAESARAVNALAYTVGPHVVFGRGQYAPAAQTGRSLLAHELAHVMQQKDIHSGTPRLSRKISVTKPKDKIANPGGGGLVQTNAKTIEDYLTTICPTGSVAVDANSGNVAISTSFCTPAAKAPGAAGGPGPAPAQKSATPTGCGCLCDLVTSAHSWRIIVDDSNWPQTNFDDNDAGLGKKPGGTGGTVTAPSPNSTKLWGAGTAGGAQLNVDPWLVLGHELCGHGWLGDSGKAAGDEALPRGEGGHQDTVARENELRKEHGIDLRGTFKDPDCGESFWRDKADPKKVNWSSYHTVCEAWRAAYNKAHGTSYKITDKIP
jgi:Domain of unknown function (DUF4157)